MAGEKQKLTAPYLAHGCTLRWSRKKIKADSTLRSSQAVPHPSTDRALSRLTSEVERDPVHSTWYGRQRQHSLEHGLCANVSAEATYLLKKNSLGQSNS